MVAETQIPSLLPDRQIDLLVALLEPFERVTQPKLYGSENIPVDGSLLVGNHTLYGLLDLPFMLAEVWKHRHVAVRSLGEHAHYAIPLWRDVLTRCGMVRGTRENVRALMSEHQTVLVFPGGAREVNKRRGEKYQLMWKERIGFARLAIEHGYPIVPFAAVGAEEMLDIIVDENNAAYAHFTELIWGVVCQVGVVDFSHSRLVGCGCGGLGGWRSGVLCATRGQADIRGFGVPQDHGSSWGAAV